LHCTSGFIYQWCPKAPGLRAANATLGIVNAAEKILRQSAILTAIAKALETIATSLLL
jgi:hypothetical protein